MAQPRYGIVSGGIVTAFGTTAQLWPDIGFPFTGPSDAFLASKNAQLILQNAARTRYQKLVPAAPYVAGDGKVYDMIAQNLTAPELAAALASYQSDQNATVSSVRQQQINAFMGPVDRTRVIFKGLNLLKQRAFQQTSALPVTWANGQAPVWNAGAAVATWFDDMTQTASAAQTAINAVSAATPNCLDAVDAIVAAISWPAHP